MTFQARDHPVVPIMHSTDSGPTCIYCSLLDLMYPLSLMRPLRKWGQMLAWSCSTMSCMYLIFILLSLTFLESFLFNMLQYEIWITSQNHSNTPCKCLPSIRTAPLDSCILWYHVWIGLHFFYHLIKSCQPWCTWLRIPLWCHFWIWKFIKHTLYAGNSLLRGIFKTLLHHCCSTYHRALEIEADGWISILCTLFYPFVALIIPFPIINLCWR